MKKALVIFVPVIHKGYLSLFNKYNDEVWILGEDILSSYTSLARDLRVIDPVKIKKILEDSKLVKKVKILSKEDLAHFSEKKVEVVMVDDDVSRDICSKYFRDGKVTFEKIFLRWDKLMTEKENVISPERKISNEENDRKFMALAVAEAEKSSDWWRQIGAVAVLDNKVIFRSHNHHLPSDLFLDTFGDPRSNFDKGERLDIYTSVHGEADIVAQSAKAGISLNGTSIYVSTFPCSNCARLLAVAGVKKVYYSKGYSRLDAEQVLRAFGVEIVLVV